MTRGQGRGTIRREKIRGKWVYRGDWTDDSGKRHRKVLGQDRDTAQRLLIEEIRKRDRRKAGLGAELGQDTDLAALASDYISEIATTCTPKHVRMMEAQLAKLPGALHAKQVRDLRPENYERYRQAQLRAGLARATVNTGLVAINGMLRWAVRTRRIAENPLDSLRVLTLGRAHQKRPKRALTEAEVGAFMAAAYAADGIASDRNRAFGERIPQGPLFRFLIETGVRWGEARQIAWADLDMDQRRLRLRAATTKNRRGRELPLKPSLADELRGLLAVHHRALGRAPRRSDPVFLTPRGKPWPADTGNVRRLYHPILEAAGIDRKNELGESVDIHSLRHTAATRMARAGLPMAKLQRLMGHRDPRTTQQYYDHLEVDDLEDGLGVVPEVGGLARSAPC